MAPLHTSPLNQMPHQPGKGFPVFALGDQPWARCGKPLCRRLISLAERLDDYLAASALNLAIHEVSPPFQHFPPLVGILRPVVDAPDALGFMS